MTKAIPEVGRRSLFSLDGLVWFLKTRGFLEGVLTRSELADLVSGEAPSLDINGLMDFLRMKLGGSVDRFGYNDDGSVSANVVSERGRDSVEELRKLGVRVDTSGEIRSRKGFTISRISMLDEERYRRVVSLIAQKKLEAAAGYCLAVARRLWRSMERSLTGATLEHTLYSEAEKYLLWARVLALRARDTGK